MAAADSTPPQTPTEQSLVRGSGEASDRLPRMHELNPRRNGTATALRLVAERRAGSALKTRAAASARSCDRARVAKLLGAACLRTKGRKSLGSRAFERRVTQHRKAAQATPPLPQQLPGARSAPGHSTKSHASLLDRTRVTSAASRRHAALRGNRYKQDTHFVRARAYSAPRRCGIPLATLSALRKEPPSALHTDRHQRRQRLALCRQECNMPA